MLLPCTSTKQLDEEVQWSTESNYFQSICSQTQDFEQQLREFGYKLKSYPFKLRRKHAISELCNISPVGTGPTDLSKKNLDFFF